MYVKLESDNVITYTVTFNSHSGTSSFSSKEVKFGDSGYYYDLFPEERDGEPDDYEKGIIGWTYDGNPIYKNGS